MMMIREMIIEDFNFTIKNNATKNRGYEKEHIEKEIPSYAEGLKNIFLELLSNFVQHGISGSYLQRSPKFLPLVKTSDMLISLYAMKLDKGVYYG